jgi:hypothetical protein
VKLLKANPTIATGDFKVSKDGGAFANLTTLPSANPASGRSIMIDLSATEMTADNVVVQCVDAAGAEWCDQLIPLKTSAGPVIYSGTAVSADNTSVTLDPAYDPDDDPTNMSLFIRSDQGSEMQLITDWDPDNLILSVAGFNIGHADNIVVTFYPFGAKVATDYAKDTAAAATDVALAAVAADVLNLKDRTPPALSAAGNMLVDLQTVKDTVQTAGDLANLAILIKAKTDPLTYTLANKVDANAKAIADDPIEGAGTTNDKWRPA